MTLSEIIARLEAATGPDKLLDQDIEDEISGWENLGDWRRRHKVTGAVERFNYQPPPPYTASVDAALTLVPDDAFWSVITCGDLQGYQAFVCIAPNPTISTDWHDGVTPALALCTAALKARSAS